MRKLQIPSEDPAEVFRTCISCVRNEALRSRLSSIEVEVTTAAVIFQNAASHVMLHTLRPQVDVSGIVSKDEMVAVYKNRMAKKGAPGRPTYDRLLASPAHGRCPLCGQRVASTLDHHLPKEHYPALAVVPTNLVPACKDCNHAKLDIISGNQAEQTLHPYFDDVEDKQWLHARVLEISSAAVQFYVNSPDDWDNLKSERIKYHFRVFKLATLYASHAAGELINIKYRIEQLFDQAGVDAVRTHLLEEAQSREAAHINSWQTAMYKALASSDWYCTGGFNFR